MTETKYEFDKGESVTGIYLTDPALYGHTVQFMETLPIDLDMSHYDFYQGRLYCIDGYDPYAFQSKREIDEYIAYWGAKGREAMLEGSTDKHLKEYEEHRKKIEEEAKLLEAKYGIRYELPDDGAGEE